MRQSYHAEIRHSCRGTSHLRAAPKGVIVKVQGGSMPDQEPTRVSRRSFYKLGAGWMACAASGVAQQNSGGAANLDRLLRSQTDPSRRILLQGGVVLSLDQSRGHLEKA